MRIEISLSDSVDTDEVLRLYRANKWSSAEKPQQLMPALRSSHSLVTARVDKELVGLGNAISDGHLVTYFPHILVLPQYQGKGVGRRMMEAMLQRYFGFHQLILTADGEAVEFHKSQGFVRAGKTEPMWVYAGGDH
jgi:GNAT superfamily N-acetyltransferase